MMRRRAHGRGQTPDTGRGSAIDKNWLRMLGLLVWLGAAAPALAQIANDDSYQVNEDSVLNVAAPGVLGNDVGLGLTAIQNSSGSNGTAVLNSDGSFTYTPDANFFGVDSFTYRATDGITQSGLATVTITVNNVNDPPTTAPDSYTTAEDTTLNVAVAQGVLANDSDIDGDTLTAQLVTNVSNGNLTLNANGSFTYTPNQNYAGGDSFTYRAADGATPNGQNPPVTVTLTINAVNDAPTANADSYNTNEDQALTVNAPGVLANDSDVEGHSLTAQIVSQPAAGTGTVSLSANGSFTYTPPLNFFGAATFTYRAIDNGSPSAQSAPATVTITVNSVNDPPVANPDNYSTNEDQPLTVAAPGVLANDGDPDGVALTAQLVSQPAAGTGTVSLNGNGSFTYTPPLNFSGTASFSYRAVDSGSAPSAPATVTITVNSLNDPPIANADSYSTNEDEALTVGAPGVLANDSDPDGNALTAQLVSQPAAGTGTVSLNANGSFTYTPPANFSGSATFTYRALDNGSPPAQSAPPTTVTITVNAVNDPPVTAPDSYSTPEDTTLNVSAAQGVLANDSDPDGTTLTAVLVGNVTNGTLSLNTNGSFTYTPNLDYTGTDSFTYRAVDGQTPDAQNPPVTVTITINAVNDAPIANPDSYSTPEDQALTVAAPGVLTNDSDPEGNALTAQLASQPAPGTGTVSLQANGSFIYTPPLNFSGTATFTYRAVDNGAPAPAQSLPATVTITVTPVNDPPAALPDGYTTAEDTTLNVTAVQGVLANDTDPDLGALLTAVLVGNVTNGTLVLNANGSFTYTPTPDYAGPDSFTYRARDNGIPLPALESAVVTVMIDVTAVNDAPRPRAVDPEPPVPDQTATENILYTLDLAPFFFDPEGNDALLTYTLTNLPDGVTASLLGLVSGTPALDTSVRECVDEQGVEVGTVALTVSDGLDSFMTTFCLRVLEAGRADLALSVAAAPAPAVINQTVDWTFTVDNLSMENVGNITIDAVISGQVPFTLSQASACTTTPQGNDTLLSCTAGPVAGSASTTVQVRGSSTQAGDVLTTATVSISDPIPLDLTPENDTASGALNIAQRLAGGPGQKITVTEHRASATGDFNGDGFLDLAVATGATQSTLVYANVPDPNNPGKRALSPQPISLGDQGVGAGIAVVDIDGDGRLDLVTARRGGQANRIFFNASPGDGSFDFAISPDPLGADTDVSNAVAVADVNGDLLLDIVFANSSPNPVFTGDGSGSFAQTASLGNGNSVDVVLVDLFGDTLPELVFANTDGDATIYSFDSVSGSYGGFVLATGPTTSVAAGDFDADGRRDLVFGRRSSAVGAPSNPVFLNTTMNGSGQFFLAAELGASPTADVLVVDTNGDGDLDIVAINATGGHQIFNNNGNGTFTLNAQQFASPGATAGAWGKLSVDDRVDVAVTGSTGVDIFYNDGLGNLGEGDTGIPVIALLGEPSIELIVEAAYQDAGATATDAIDGDLSAVIQVDNPVDTAVLGTYTVTYTVRDKSGNAALPVTRTVTVGARTGTGGGGGGSVGWGMILFLATLGLARALGRRRFRRSEQ